MYRIPRWWRRFKALMTVQDILQGRKTVVETHLDDGTVHKSIEVVKL